jgi:hypothetical protein
LPLKKGKAEYDRLTVMEQKLEEKKKFLEKL